jgi:hypothetical protein
MQQAMASRRRPTATIRLGLIERTIARETSPETSPATPRVPPTIVLGDVSPRHMKTAAVLQACDVDLGIAMRSRAGVRHATGAPPDLVAGLADMRETIVGTH